MQTCIRIPGVLDRFVIYLTKIKLIKRKHLSRCFLFLPIQIDTPPEYPFVKGCGKRGVADLILFVRSFLIGLDLDPFWDMNPPAETPQISPAILLLVN